MSNLEHIRKTINQILFTDADHLSCYKQLCKVLEVLDEPAFFQEICSRGEIRFRDSGKSFQFLKLKCDFHLKRDEVEEALLVLRKVLPVSRTN